eukprot:3626111-Prymnesium_polylepis.2
MVNAHERDLSGDCGVGFVWAYSMGLGKYGKPVVRYSRSLAIGEVTRGIEFSPFRLHTKEGVDSQ